MREAGIKRAIALFEAIAGVCMGMKGWYVGYRTLKSVWSCMWAVSSWQSIPVCDGQMDGQTGQRRRLCLSCALAWAPQKIVS